MRAFAFAIAAEVGIDAGGRVGAFGCVDCAGRPHIRGAQRCERRLSGHYCHYLSGHAERQGILLRNQCKFESAGS